MEKVSFKFKKGFTLFEMLVSLAIITLIAGIVVYNYSQFNNDIEITNLAYRMAISIRQAQVYSISVRQFPNAPDPFRVPYGIHFSEKMPEAFILYADADGNGRYTFNSDDTVCDIGPDSECLEKVLIGRSNRIKGFCGILWPNNNAECFDANGDNLYHSLDIKFRRPNPDAIFSIYEDDYVEQSLISEPCLDANGSSVACSGWAICLTSPHGREKRVVVYETGQISVENVVSDTACAQ